MALNLVLYVAFICAACVVAYLFPARLRYVWLWLCDWGFYAWACSGPTLHMPQTLVKLGFGQTLPAFVPALCALVFTTLASWLFTLLMARAQRPAHRVVFLCLAVATSLSLWAACKYLGLFSYFRPLSADETTLPAAGLALPLGLSYYTVQAAVYAADVFCGRCPAEKNPLRYAAFTGFFPLFFTGPIQRAETLLAQLKVPAKFDYGRVAGGLFRILWGVFKLSVLAASLSLYTGPILKNPTGTTGPYLLLAVLLFAWQLYADFSGCCDIAAGAARMLGFALGENFARPFAAKTFAGFWARWYTSLVTILQTYIFAPIAKSRWAARLPFLGRFFTGPSATTAVLATFLLFGAWHGLSAQYLLFGLSVGGILAIARLLHPYKEKAAAAVPLYRIPAVRGVFQRIFVYLLFCGCLGFFIGGLYGQPFGSWAGFLTWGWGSFSFSGLLAIFARAGLTWQHLCVVGGGIALVEVLEFLAARKGRSIAGWIRKPWFFIRWPLYYLLIAAIIFFAVLPVPAGIYQAF